MSTQNVMMAEAHPKTRRIGIPGGKYGPVGACKLLHTVTHTNKYITRHTIKAHTHRHSQAKHTSEPELYIITTKIVLSIYA